MSDVSSDSAGGRLLIVDDDPMVLRTMKRALQHTGYAIHTAASGADARALLERQEIDVAVLDLALQDVSGLDVLKAIKEHDPAIECVVMTGHSSAPAAVASYDAGAVEYFEKPITDWRRFHDVLLRALRQTRQTRERDQEPHTAPPSEVDQRLRREMTGSSKAVEDLRRAVYQVAMRAAHALVVGAPGTGKGAVARLMHRLSGRQGPLEELSCVGLEGRDGGEQLFGDARTGKPGALARAAGGTLILRDLEAMSPALQTELAAHLAREEGDAALRARVVATCGPDVDAAASQLRPELFSRFGSRVRVPGLNERRADIPQLVYQMVRSVNAEEKTDVKRVPSDVIQALMDHDWSDGNLRALRGIIAAAAVLSPGEALERWALSLRARSSHPREALPERPGEVDRLPERYRGLSYAEFKERLLSDFMGSYVRDLLDATGGNVTSASRLAGLHRPNFRRLMKRYGIDFDDDGE